VTDIVLIKKMTDIEVLVFAVCIRN